jgi:hypothetical protein
MSETGVGKRQAESKSMYCNSLINFLICDLRAEERLTQDFGGKT